MVPTLEYLIDVPPPEHSFSTPSRQLNNYLGKISTRFWNDILMLNFLRSRKRNDPSVVFCFAGSCKEANIVFCFVSCIKKPTYCQLLTSFRRSNRMFVDVFIECVAWSCWWTWCVLPIICNSKHFSFFVFYFNVSNKISSTPPLLLDFQFSNLPFILTPASIRHSKVD